MRTINTNIFSYNTQLWLFSAHVLLIKDEFLVNLIFNFSVINSHLCSRNNLSVTNFTLLNCYGTKGRKLHYKTVGGRKKVNAVFQVNFKLSMQ